MKGLRIAGAGLFAVIIFGAGIGGGIFIDRLNSNVITSSQIDKADLQLINQAWDLIHQKYVDQSAVTPQNLTYGAISGMVISLGDTDHSVFLTPEDVKLENIASQEKFGGIGTTVGTKDGNVVIVAPMDGLPAQKAGLQSGDIILKIDGQAVTGIEDAVNHIRGPVGTSVTITIQNSSGTINDITIVRAEIPINTVFWQILPGTSIADLQIASFSEGTSTELDTALSAIKAQGVTGIILDLRDNGGGVLSGVIGVASRFLNGGYVLEEKDINGNITKDPVLANVPKTNLQMVVLINQWSASGAEVVAGALQDVGRAKLIGETTFGTGTVLVTYPLSDGSALSLGIQEWLTPSGHTIWHTGLTPDTVVSLPTSVTLLFPQAEKGLSQAQIQSSGDQQLLDAISSFP
jgi:carboxyl-terminal processing protease